jgi:HEAT repeat protein
MAEAMDPEAAERAGRVFPVTPGGDAAPQVLTPDDAARLVEFARACKAAARAVALYPGGHPSISTTLGRIVQLTSPVKQSAPMRLHVTADNILLDGRATARPDQSVAELAQLLHEHLVGELTVHAGGDVEGWRNFVQLLGRPADDVRHDGGIARLWTTIAGRHVEIREIDYSEVLREKAGGDAATWDRVINNCLHGDLQQNDEALRGLLEIAGDPAKLGSLVSALDARATTAGETIEGKTAAIIRLIQGVVDVVRKQRPDAVEPTLQNVASAMGELTSEILVSLLTQTRAEGRETSGTVDTVASVFTRMSDQTIARFVAKNAIAEGSAMDRLAQAFQTLVRGGEQRDRLLAMAKADAARSSPLGNTSGFEEVWSHVAERLLQSYSDEPFISGGYARELSTARVEALSVEQTNDDPPERIEAWMATVATGELRSLDITLLVDLLRIEQDNERWADLMEPIVALIEDLLLVGDVDGADGLLQNIREQAGPGTSKERRQSALVACDLLAAGPMLRHVISNLPAMDPAQFERVKAMCASLGEVLVRPLAEALSVENQSATRERLTGILIAFGPAGRRQVERLKSSPNPAVRRTAIYLLREFGGTDALPDLTELLDDNEPQVQREAVRAIMNIGNDRAFRVLEQALVSGTETTRAAIMRSLGSMRDDRAAPLFAYIVTHVDHRGPLGPIYLRAIESLGSLRDPDGVPALKTALYRGEWWAPRRTSALRRAAASALARIGSEDAVSVLQEAAARGPRGVRSAARASLSRKEAQS